LLNQPLPEYANQPLPEPMAFQKEINLKNISFRYFDNTPWVINNVNLNIKKGSRVGFIGETGAGKSTLLDIIMGLLEVTNGSILIDNIAVTKENFRSWQGHIAHVPQDIFLIDGTIEENIAFGVKNNMINHDRVVKSLEQARIKGMVESWEDKYKTFVGERGIRLSGGQRQRIGIARALYKQASVLIFDEATNALDNKTEQLVMESIEDLDSDLTILIIAHRLSTLKGCNQIVELSKDGVKSWNQ
jgi:ATP-binding cassette, subfamily B, bacterial PglK